MIVCENCMHRDVCEDKYTMKPQHACLYYYSSEYTFIARLEKIKEEIDNIIYGMKMCDEISAEAYTQITARTERIFDNYIKELKGE